MILFESRARFGESNRSETRAIRRLDDVISYPDRITVNLNSRTRLVLTGMLYSEMRYACMCLVPLSSFGTSLETEKDRFIS